MGYEPLEVLQRKLALLPRVDCALPAANSAVSGFGMGPIYPIVHHTVLSTVELVRASTSTPFQEVFHLELIGSVATRPRFLGFVEATILLIGELVHHIC